jgi:hypothetical protein
LPEAQRDDSAEFAIPRRRDRSTEAGANSSSFREGKHLNLYHHGSSVCAAKVRFALGEKNLAWQGHYLDILKGDQFAPEYQKLNPKAVVPTLDHDDNVIVESTVINEYLDEAFPDVPLKPKSPVERALSAPWPAVPAAPSSGGTGISTAAGTTRRPKHAPSRTTSTDARCRTEICATAASTRPPIPCTCSSVTLPTTTWSGGSKAS